MNKSLHLLMSLTLGLVIVLTTLVGLGLVRDQAVPATAATQDEIVEYAFFAPNTAITADVCSAAVNARVAGQVEAHVVFTMSGTINTATLTLEHTNFNPAAGPAHWVDGADASLQLITHTNHISDLVNRGVFTRLCIDVVNTQTVRLGARGKFYPGSNY